MCGIVGFLDRTRNKDSVINEMMDRIVHRGPNSSGSYSDNDIALGFRRLSIIDLEGGNQPIFNEDKTKIIIFNGEIYNYDSIKSELIKTGHVFTTNSDTEVILHGYEQWGISILSKLRGMFSFAIWDNINKKLFCARDHFGIKPLYYAKMDKTFLFGSEIKSFFSNPNFKKELNEDALGPFLTFQYSALNRNATFFKNVYSLGPGQYFLYENQKMIIENYWVPDYSNKEDYSESEWVNLIDEKVVESINVHKVSDVPVASFLSSGVDSSYVTSVLKPSMSYSVSFDDKTYNEAAEAKKLSEKIGIGNTSIVINREESFKNFPLIQYHLDEPDANPSCIPLFFLTKLASKEYKVVMSGEGADELFAGYQSYGFLTNSKTVRIASKLLKKLPKNIRYKLGSRIEKMGSFPGKSHLYVSIADPAEHFIGHAKIFDEEEKKNILAEKYHGGPTAKDIMNVLFKETLNLEDDINRMQYVDLKQWMPKDILLKADKLAMAHSLEVRTPLLDKELMILAQKIPEKYLVNEHNTKYVFRKAAFKHLPPSWANREKLGFPVPIKTWLREESGYKHVKELFAEDFSKIFFNQSNILDLLERHYKREDDLQRKIWTIYTFLTWYKVFFIDDKKYFASKMNIDL